MKVIVNDANILIDLVELRLLPQFFALEFEFLTTELVLAELFDEQKQSLLPYIDNGILIVQEMTAEDLIEVYNIQATKPSQASQNRTALLSTRPDCTQQRSLPAITN